MHKHTHTHNPWWPQASWISPQCPFSSTLSWIIKEHLSCCASLCVRLCINVMTVAGVYVHGLLRACARLIKSPFVWGCICQPLPPLWSFELAALFERTSLINSSLCNQCPTGIQHFPHPCLPACLPAASWRTIWERWPDEQAAGGTEGN